MPSGPSQSTEGDSTDQQSPQTATTEWIFDLPRQLENTIPLCANACVSSYISQDWSCSTNNLTCLCSDYSSEGFTLAELALLCIGIDCPNATKDQKVDAYGACDSQPDAVRPTHSTLTLPTNFPTPTRTATSRTSLPHTTSTKSTPNPSVSAMASGSSLSITTSVPSTKTHSPTATAGAAAPKTSKDSTSVTTAEAVGISVACMGALMAALGLFYLYACIKRRKAAQAKEQRHSYDFVDDAPPRLPPFNHGSADSRGPLAGFAPPRVELASEKHRTVWPVPRSNPYEGAHFQHSQYHEKPVDRSPEIGRSISPGSPHSDCSMRTTSQLLPEKPSGIVPPRRPLPPKSPPMAVINTPETVFEEDRSMRIPAALIPGGGLPAHPAVSKTRQPQYTNHYTRSPEPMKVPALSLEIPRKASGSGSLGTLGGFPPPPPPAARPSDDGQRRDNRSKSRDSNNSLLNYYASPDCASPDDLYSSTPIEEGSQVRRPPPTAITVTKPTYPPKAVRISTASDTSRRTSFESTDPDEPTPPEEEDKQLTPVAEVESPISGIRYPKVPRSSNQSVPRSPNYGGSPRLGTNPGDHGHFGRREMPQIRPVTPGQQKSKHSPSPSLSGSTLAAKRRGDSAAQGLHIMTSSNPQYSMPRDNRPVVVRQNQRHESPLKGYGRVANTRPESEWPLVNGKEMDTAAPMKSPLWEPKLTPRKEGDDLYLSVSAATPKAARFHVR